MRIWLNSTKGRKAENEDFILHQDMGKGKYLCLIADGMGGYANGKLTAEFIAVNLSVFLTSQAIINEHIIQVAINKSNLLLRQAQENGAEVSGATIGGVYIEKQFAIIFWVGDIKIYHLRGNYVAFENIEHSLIMNLRNKGITINLEKKLAYQHMVTKSVHGNVSDSNADFHKVDPLDKEDIFVICSDGFQVHHLKDLILPKTINNRIQPINFHEDGRQDDASIAVLAVHQNIR